MLYLASVKLMLGKEAQLHVFLMDYVWLHQGHSIKVSKISCLNLATNASIIFRLFGLGLNKINFSMGIIHVDISG